MTVAEDERSEYAAEDMSSPTRDEPLARSLGGAMVVHLVDRVGERAARVTREALDITLLPYAALKGAVFERGRGASLVLRGATSQAYFTAVEPLPVFVTIALVTGFLAISISDLLMRPNGLAPYVPSVVAVAVVREIVPVIVALVLVGRSGTAIATELGTMRVSQEIDALDACGINTDYFLVLPRLVGVTLATIALHVVMSFVALVGGFALGEAIGLVSVGLSLGDVLGAVSISTIAYALTKAVLFGLIISSTCCFHGLSVGRAFHEIPRANVRAAVQCYLACLVADAVLGVHALAEQIR